MLFIFSICGCGKKDEGDGSKTPVIEETPIIQQELVQQQKNIHK